MKINTAIKKLRTFLGASQQDFATGLGISTRGLANYESNRTPPLLILGKLSKVVAGIRDVNDAGELVDGPMGELSDGVASAIRMAFILELKKAKPPTLLTYEVDPKPHQGAILEGGILLASLRSIEEYDCAIVFDAVLRGLREPHHRDLARQTLRAMVEAAQPLMHLTGAGKTLVSMKREMDRVDEELKLVLVGAPEELRRKAGITEEIERELYGAPKGIKKGKKK